MKTTAIILSAGKGKRMHTNISKQYICVRNKPILYYTLSAFQKSDVDDMIIVAGEDDIEFVQKEIVEKYNFDKVHKIVKGGKERYDSVICGLNACKETDQVLIHDGARPLIKSTEINNIIAELSFNKACVAAMPVKDTIKIADEQEYVSDTPERNRVWQVQTPQAFTFSLIKEAYSKMEQNKDTSITDDAMVVEKYTDTKVKLIRTSYNNIKITTGEDLVVLESLLEE